MSSHTWSICKEKVVWKHLPRPRLTWNSLSYGIRCACMHTCVCVSVCVVLNAFPQLFSDIFKGSEQSRNCKFSNKHNDLKCLPFQTVKLVTESFGKFHVIIELLTQLVRLQTMNLKVCTTRSTNLWSYLRGPSGMLYFKGVSVNLHSFPFNFWLQVFLVFFL